VEVACPTQPAILPEPTEATAKPKSTAPESADVQARAPIVGVIRIVVGAVAVVVGAVILRSLDGCTLHHLRGRAGVVIGAHKAECLRGVARCDGEWALDLEGQCHLGIENAGMVARGQHADDARDCTGARADSRTLAPISRCADDRTHGGCADDRAGLLAGRSPA